MNSTIKVEGFKELAEALRELPERVAKNTLRRAVSSGAAIIRNEARVLAPVDTGEMRKDIQIKRERDTKGIFSASYSVFVRSGKKSRLSGRARNIQKDSFYWRFVEFGTAKMNAHPFMRPAFQHKKDQALNQIKETLDAGIQKTANELYKK